jgi:hypothetical protein
MTEQQIVLVKDLIEEAIRCNEMGRPDEVDELLRDVLNFLTKGN